MAKTSYAFASGAVRAHETALLTRQDMDQLLALRTPERVTAALRDKGYGLPAGDRENMEDLTAAGAGEAVGISPQPRTGFPAVYPLPGAKRLPERTDRPQGGPAG